MRLLSLFSSAALLITAVHGQVLTQSPPGLQFLYSANITVGLSVDVGAIPAGNVTVIPLIGGAVNGPKIAGKGTPLSSYASATTPPSPPNPSKKIIATANTTTTGKILAIGADWSLATPSGYSVSDMRAQIRTMDNSNIYVQMSGLKESNNGLIYVRTTFQTGSKDYWWLNYAFAFGTMRPSGTGYVVDMWQLTY